MLEHGRTLSSRVINIAGINRPKWGVFGLEKTAKEASSAARTHGWGSVRQLARIAFNLDMVWVVSGGSANGGDTRRPQRPPTAASGSGSSPARLPPMWVTMSA